jgi:hypothetical protein
MAIETTDIGDLDPLALDLMAAQRWMGKTPPRGRLKMAEQVLAAGGSTDEYEKIRKALNQARAEEREACAQVAEAKAATNEERGWTEEAKEAQVIAAFIRNRSERAG